MTPAPATHAQVRQRLQALIAAPDTKLSWRDADDSQSASATKRARTFLTAVAITTSALTGSALAQSRTTPAVWLESLERAPVEVSLAGRSYWAPHPLTRYLLSKQAADEQRLESVGLSWKHVYAMAEAESSWVARDGMGENGRVSVGIAQMEEPTAKALGIDPRDQQQALMGIAQLAKASLQWAQARNADPKLALSVYYNLSTKGRQAWDGSSTQGLPQATLNHIRNVEQGLLMADQIETGVRALQRQRAAQVAREIQARFSGPSSTSIQFNEASGGQVMKDPDTQRHTDAIGFGQMNAVARDLLDRARRISAQHLDESLQALRLTPAQREALRSSLRAQSFPAVSLMRQAVATIRDMGIRAAHAMADLGKSVDVSPQDRERAAIAMEGSAALFTLPSSDKAHGMSEVAAAMKGRVQHALAHLRDSSVQASLVTAKSGEPSPQEQMALQHASMMTFLLDRPSTSMRMRGG